MNKGEKEKLKSAAAAGEVGFVGYFFVEIYRKFRSLIGKSNSQ